MATVEELIAGFDAGLDGTDPSAMIATLAPGAVVWHDYDRKIVDARENMAAVATLAQIVRDAKMERVRVEEFDGGFLYQFVLHATVIASGKPFEMHNCIVATTADGLVTRIDEYVDPTAGAQLAP
jgi:ketosteroid isomerase-like protein